MYVRYALQAVQISRAVSMCTCLGAEPSFWCLLLVFKGVNLKDAKNIFSKPLGAVLGLGQLLSFLLLSLQQSDALGICIIMVNISRNLV